MKDGEDVKQREAVEVGQADTVEVRDTVIVTEEVAETELQEDEDPERLGLEETVPETLEVDVIDELKHRETDGVGVPLLEGHTEELGVFEGVFRPEELGVGLLEGELDLEELEQLESVEVGVEERHREEEALGEEVTDDEDVMVCNEEGELEVLGHVEELTVIVGLLEAELVVVGEAEVVEERHLEEVGVKVGREEKVKEEEEQIVTVEVVESVVDTVDV